MNTIPLSWENMEALLRRLVLKQPNIKQISERAIGLVGDSKILTGVKIRTAAEEDTEISADLVVGGYHWLQDLYGSGSVEAKNLAALRQTFKHKYVCTTHYFSLTVSFLEEMSDQGIPGIKDGEFHYIHLSNPAIDTRSLGIWILEGNIRRTNLFLGIFSLMGLNLVTINCCGYDLQEETNEIEDIRQFFKNMVMEEPLQPYMYTLLDVLENRGISFSFSTLRCPYVQYAKAQKLPSNFVGIGDAVMQFNPIKGQGIAKASVEVITLNTLLSQCKSTKIPQDFGKSFFKLQATRTGPTCDLYKCDDYVYTSQAWVIRRWNVLWVHGSRLSVERRGEVERLLGDKKAESRKLGEIWQAGEEVKDTKCKLEEAKHDLDVAQQEGQFDTASRLRYSVIPELEVKLPKDDLLPTSMSGVREHHEDGAGDGHWIEGLLMVHDRVTSEDIVRVVAKATGILVQSLLKGEREKLTHMEDALRQRIIGQDAALRAV
ncbi:hypothetical protein M422DRAFT_275857 [Sphaerobolus stellatus SS14]|uniref:Uncharacterized protein n=1 Tax=Sphaerobolus stellatus (strain SS14) TaxID=990650 RepID=A0A0C9U386_SPHS4|nr:hypothetical protein M422DRAFT_275857 [Sphaerobolus stellatus SS14]